MENDEGCSVFWPEELPEGSKKCIEKILFGHNKNILKYGLTGGQESLYNDNSFLLIFEEGGVIFNLRVDEDNTLCASVEGMFIPWMYMPTAWLMINKLMAYVRTNTFDEYYEMKCLYEKELDEYLEEHNVEYSLPFDRAHNDIPFSFAVALGDPDIPGVRFFPCGSAVGSLPPIKTNSEDVSDELVTCLEISEPDTPAYDADFVIERLHSVHPFSRKDLNEKKIGFTNWAMKYVGTYPMNKRIEALRFLNSGKAVRFNRIREIMNNMKKYG